MRQGLRQVMAPLKQHCDGIRTYLVCVMWSISSQNETKDGTSKLPFQLQNTNMAAKLFHGQKQRGEIVHADSCILASIHDLKLFHCRGSARRGRIAPTIYNAGRAPRI